MVYVTVTIALCSIPAGLGAIVDRLLLRRHKGRLHDALLRYWVHLDELSLPDIWRVFADYAISFFKRIFGTRIRSFRFIITLTLVSFCLTFCALTLGRFLEYGSEPALATHTLVGSYWIGLFFINLVFDTLTALVTVKVLSVIYRSTVGKAITLIVLDVILALFFAIACLTSGIACQYRDRHRIYHQLD